PGRTIREPRPRLQGRKPRPRRIGAGRAPPADGSDARGRRPDPVPAEGARPAAGYGRAAPSHQLDRSMAGVPVGLPSTSRVREVVEVPDGSPRSTDAPPAAEGARSPLPATLSPRWTSAVDAAGSAYLGGGGSGRCDGASSGLARRPATMSQPMLRAASTAG